MDLAVREDRFQSSLFSEINEPDSSINILIGSKKFIEGWSSWRVSAMGLLNMGKGEGPQVIQLFGRGVRLKGRHDSLKRSSALVDDRPHPPEIAALETLLVFGWNADYVAAFRRILRGGRHRARRCDSHPSIVCGPARPSRAGDPGGLRCGFGDMDSEGGTSSG